MNRREFSLQLAGLAGAAALASLGLPARAADGTPVDGKDYTRLSKPLPMNATGKVEVVEFFWYGCPHCFAFEPTLEPWAAKLPPDVHFVRVPVAFDALKEIHQQIYYTWDALGLVEQMHRKTFDRFHVAHKPINREDDMLAFAKENGLDAAKVKAAWESFGVQTRLRGAERMEQDYGIDHMPQMAVQGRWTTASSERGRPDVIAVTEGLIAMARKGA